MSARNTERLEHSQRSLYTVLCLKRWLNLILYLMESGFAVAVTAIATHLPDLASGIGVGITLNIMLETSAALRQLVDSWTTVEMSLGTVERLRDIGIHNPTEDDPCDMIVPLPSWPSNGRLEVSNLTVSYQ